MTLATPATTPVQSITWFEIPCTDLDGAQRFYEAVIGRPMQRTDFGGDPLAVFTYDRPATGGCLASGPARQAAGDAGVRIYLDCGGSVETALARASAAGGTAEAGVVELPHGIGWIGHMRDLDGNRIGLHAPGR